MNYPLKSSDLPPFRPLPQKPPSVDVTRKPDGSITIRSRYPLGAMHRSIALLLEAKAGLYPGRNFIAERTSESGGKLGAMKARVPVAPVSAAYSLMSGDHSKLRHVFDTARPHRFSSIASFAVTTRPMWHCLPGPI